MAGESQDFTTYTVRDDKSFLTITADRISFNALDRDRTSRVSYDFGAGFFDGDFTHYLSTYISSSGTTALGLAYPYVLANLLLDMNSIPSGNNDCVFMQDTTDASIERKIRLITFGSGGSGQVDEFYVDKDVVYFLEINRDDNGGGSSTGRYTAYIRTGSHDGVLIETLTLDVAAQIDFRYHYGMNSYDGTDSVHVISGYQELTYLNGLPTPPTPTPFRKDAGGFLISFNF